MTEKQTAKWLRAAGLARDAMGKVKLGGGRTAIWVWKADEDPLAWWCLTEAIHDFK